MFDKQKLNQIVGITMEQFKEFIDDTNKQPSAGKGLTLRPSRLIPMLKVGDEMALSSVLLASLRLVKEFKEHILSDIKMARGGTLHAYTEVAFSEFDNCRVDGLLLIEKAGKIVDAAIIEVKKGVSELDQKQIEKYIEVAKRYKIKKVVTISNEYVSSPGQFPLNIRSKDVELYHLSWSHIQTVGTILLFDKKNISDPDQVEIMREVLFYFEHKDSEICGFTRMKKGWTETAENLIARNSLNSSDNRVREAVLSWQQEERDIANILSRELGIMVYSGQKEFKTDYQKRVEHDINALLNDRELKSIFQIEGAVSDLTIKADVLARTVRMYTTLKVPQDKTLKGQVGWIKKQLESCQKKNPDDFNKNMNEYCIELSLKNQRKEKQMPIKDLNSFAEENKNMEIKECKIIQSKDFGKHFTSSRKFVEIIEEMVRDYYRVIVQNLKKWEPPVPSLKAEQLATPHQQEVAATNPPLEVQSETIHETESVMGAADLISNEPSEKENQEAS